jgi:hypothetical protein
MDGERRIVTILFCDVKGSTAMAEKLDPEEWSSIMNRPYEHLIAPVSRRAPGRHRDHGRQHSRSSNVSNRRISGSLA